MTIGELINELKKYDEPWRKVAVTVVSNDKPIGIYEIVSVDNEDAKPTASALIHAGI